jgi:hypothetical protein
MNKQKSTLKAHSVQSKQAASEGKRLEPTSTPEHKRR